MIECVVVFVDYRNRIGSEEDLPDIGEHWYKTRYLNSYNAYYTKVSDEDLVYLQIADILSANIFTKDELMECAMNSSLYVEIMNRLW